MRDQNNLYDQYVINLKLKKTYVWPK